MTAVKFKILVSWANVRILRKWQSAKMTRFKYHFCHFNCLMSKHFVSRRSKSLLVTCVKLPKRIRHNLTVTWYQSQKTIYYQFGSLVHFRLPSITAIMGNNITSNICFKLISTLCDKKKWLSEISNYLSVVKCHVVLKG